MAAKEEILVELVIRGLGFDFCKSERSITIASQQALMQIDLEVKTAYINGRTKTMMKIFELLKEYEIIPKEEYKMTYTQD